VNSERFAGFLHGALEKSSGLVRDFPSLLQRPPGRPSKGLIHESPSRATLGRVGEVVSPWRPSKLKTEKTGARHSFVNFSIQMNVRDLPSVVSLRPVSTSLSTATFLTLSPLGRVAGEKEVGFGLRECLLHSTTGHSRTAWRPRPKPGLYVKTILEPQDPAYGRLRLRAQRMVGLWLSLNVLSFQTSLETWTTAAIINWSRAAESVQVEEEYVWKLTQDIDFSQLHWLGSG